VKTVFGDVMLTNLFNTTVMEDSTASYLTLKKEAVVSSNMSVPISYTNSLFSEAIIMKNRASLSQNVIKDKCGRFILNIRTLY
jgi:hypothetical protein